MRKLGLLIFVAGCCFHGLLEAEGPARILQSADVASKIYDVRQLQIMGSGDFVVTGNQTFDGWFIKADRIVFKPAATLSFSRQAQEARRNFFIVAREIVSEDAGKPGTITWIQPPLSSPPGPSGQATGGANMNNYENVAGARGNDGGQGDTGLTGASPPSLTIIALRVPSSGPRLDFGGQKGGQGGTGQTGGDGGVGGHGNSASQGMFGCNRGAGGGYTGGSGGNGGSGGTGGVGGSGGTVTIISTSDSITNLPSRFRTITSGGEGGSPGNGGTSGRGGQGGSGGAQQLPYCQGDGGNGPVGGPGGTGPSGQVGRKGVDGDLLLGATRPEDFETLFKGGTS